MTFFSCAVEGPHDEVVLRRVVQHLGAAIHRMQVQNGKANLRRALPGYNQAANWSPWLVLVDLNGDAPCPPTLVHDWLPSRSPLMRFRVVVRAIEAWLLADRERFAAFFSVRPGLIPPDPEALPDPKAALIGVVAQSRRRAIRDDMLPAAGSGRRVGRGYTGRIIEFVTGAQAWRPEVAALHAPSLRKCIDRAREL